MATNTASASLSAMTLPNVIHYLQTEFSKYERDRNYWELERSEMKARIAKLEGERKANERMRDRFQRRLRMMEHALHEERLKSDPEAVLPPATDMEVTVNKRSRHDKAAATFEHDEAYLEVVKTSQEALREQAGRQKARTYLEKCLLEVTYLVNAMPHVSSGKQVELNPEVRQDGPGPRGEATSQLPGPRPMRESPSSHEDPAKLGERIPPKSKATMNGTTNGGQENDAGVYEVRSEPMLLDDTDPVERIQHTYDANGNYIESLPSEMAQVTISEEAAPEAPAAWASQDDTWDFGPSPSSTTATEPVFRATTQIEADGASPVSALCVTQIDSLAWTFAAFEDGGIRIYRGFESIPVATLSDHSGPISSLTHAPASSTSIDLFSAGEDLVIRRWRIDTDPSSDDFVTDEARPATTYISHTTPICGLAIVGAHLVSASLDGSVRKWHLETGDSVHVWWPPETDTKLVPSAVCALKEGHFAVGYMDGRIKLFNVTLDKDGSLLKTPMKRAITRLAAREDGESLLVASAEGLYSVETAGSKAAVLLDSEEAVSVSSGREHFSSSHVKGIKVWSSGGTLVQEVPLDGVTSLASIVSGDKEYIVAASRHGTINVFTKSA